MRELVLVGIGAGDPDHLTLAAVRALGRVDVVFVVVKEDEVDELVAARRAVLARHPRPDGVAVREVALPDPPRPWRTAPDYAAAVAAWRAARLAAWTAAVDGALAEGETGAFLVWGDPSLYESTLAIAHEVAAACGDVAVSVVPGVSSVAALAARHAIALNRVGRPVTIMPGRRLAEDGWPAGAEDVVVMLDAHGAYETLDPEGLDIYWGAYLGTPDERLLSGPLREMGVVVSRARVRAREAKGWLFDVYLLRRRAAS